MHILPRQKLHRCNTLLDHTQGQSHHTLGHRLQPGHLHRQALYRHTRLAQRLGRRVGQLDHAVAAGAHLAGQHLARGCFYVRERVLAVVTQSVFTTAAQALAGGASAFEAIGFQSQLVAQRSGIDGFFARGLQTDAATVFKNQGDMGHGFPSQCFNASNNASNHASNNVPNNTLNSGDRFYARQRMSDANRPRLGIKIFVQTSTSACSASQHTSLYLHRKSACPRTRRAPLPRS